LSGGRQVFVWLMIGLLAACSSPTVTRESPSASNPAPRSTPNLSVTVVPAMLSKPAPVSYQIALRHLREGTWDVSPQRDEDHIRLAMAERVPRVVTPTSHRRAPLPPPPEPLWISAAQARAYAEAVFLAGDVDLMLSVADCEAGNADGIPSELNVHAKNPFSTAAGSFQHLAGWYTGRWGSFGAFDPYDPVQSFAAAAYLLYDAGGISNWYASRHCWG
jgi:hypothetical protein